MIGEREFTFLQKDLAKQGPIDREFFLELFKSAVRGDQIPTAESLYASLVQLFPEPQKRVDVLELLMERDWPARYSTPAQRGRSL